MRLYVGVCAMFALVLLAPTLHVFAAPVATFTVNSDVDAPDKKPGNGKCETAKNNGVCTLRAAIMETNKLGGTNVINLPAGNYVLSRAGANEDEAKTGDLDIKNNVTIKGAGSATTIIDGSRAVTSDRVFHILSGVVQIQNVVIHNGGDDAANTQFKGGGIYIAINAKLTLLKSVVGGLVGSSQYGNRAAMGGGIYSEGTLVLKNSTISQNSATSTMVQDLYGGGIFGAFSSNITLTKSRVNDNSAAFRGGGIYTDGKLVIKKSTLEYNIGDNTLGYYSYGGAIHNGSGNVTITDSIIQYNSAQTYGGGITNFGTLNLKASTVSTNSALYGGGLFNGYETANILNSTFIYNTGYTDAGAILNDDNGTVVLMNATIAQNNNYNGVGNSGGLYRVTGTVQLRNSILAGNYPHDCYGTFNSQDYNLIQDAPACTFTGTTGNNLLGTNPMFATYANHGGPTQTLSLQSSSPAIDKAKPTGCTDEKGAVLTKDQRGSPRPIDGDGTGGARCDIGAYEYP